MEYNKVLINKEDLTNTRKSVLLFTNIDHEGKLSIKPEIMNLIGGDEELLKYVNSVIKTIPNHDNPSEISHFNYHYVDQKLVNIDTGKPFHWVNQAHYDALGDTIVRHIQNLMVKDYNLLEVQLPISEHYSGTGPRNNIFMSKDALTCDTLVLLIQGAGAVRCGQWARALCINENLSIGTVLPYLKQCFDRGYGVIVFNPNLNEAPIVVPEIKRDSFLIVEKVMKPRVETVKIEGNENYRRHGEYVWDNFVQKSSSSKIAIVAHSRGGDNTTHLLATRTNEMLQRVCAIAFTDSVHCLGWRDPEYIVKFIQENGCNWVTSSLPLGQPVRHPSYDCIHVSAGHTQHEYTSGCAIDDVWKWFDQKINNKSS